MAKAESRRRMSSLPEAAEQFGVSVKTLRRYISAGRITGYRFGPRMLRVDLDELDALLLPLAAGGVTK
ncbi:helix-turn-helix domain-containing protein [Dietzia sp. SLG310A2-38A2]|nr:helix-turn-helix domain-containing protein [Dietzia sp. SLG310A2-38A2]